MTTSEVRKREDQLLADFMDGRQVADMANVLDVDEWVVEAAIRNAIRRRERSKEKQRVAALLAEPWCETHGRYGCIESNTCYYPDRKAAKRG